MTIRCKVGDMAIIINEEPLCLENIGRVVEVTGPAAISIFGQVAWNISPAAGESIRIVNRLDEVRMMLQGESDIALPDAWLQPIRPRAEDTKSREKEADLKIEKELELCH